MGYFYQSGRSLIRRDRKVVSYLRDGRVAITARYKDGEMIELRQAHGAINGTR